MMTPGFAKPRSELPWLPYPESDKVFVINSHNFTPSGPNLIGDELLVLQGPTGLTDLSGNGNVASYNGGMGVVADTGAGGVSAFSFDGTNDFISLGSALVTAAPLSFSAWIKPANTSSGFRTIASISDIAGANHQFILRQNGTTLQVQTAAGGTVITASFAESIGTDWIHVVGEFASAASRTPYAGGVAGNTSTVGRTPVGVDRTTFGFGYGSANQGYFSGLIDDIRVFDRVLTSGEIAQLGAQRG
jgi:hypothetical protein